MNNQLAVASGSLHFPSPDEWSTMLQMADVVIKSGLAPEAIRTPQAALVIMQKGRELGIAPFYALSSISVIKGKPVCGAELLLAVVYRDHGDNAIRVTHTDNESCTVAYKRRQWEGCQEYTFTLSDAKAAGLTGNQTWQKYPAAMLRARCISAVARLAFADSIGGMYLPEEMGAAVTVNDDGVVEVVADHAPAPATNEPLRGSIGQIHAQQAAQVATKAQREEYEQLQFDLAEIAEKRPKDAPADITAGEIAVWIRKAREKYDDVSARMQVAFDAQADAAEAAERDADPVTVAPAVTEGEVVSATPMEQLCAFFVQSKFPGDPHPQHVLKALQKEGYKGAPTVERLDECKSLLERHYINNTPNGWTKAQGVKAVADSYADTDDDPFTDAIEAGAPEAVAAF